MDRLENKSDDIRLLDTMLGTIIEHLDIKMLGTLYSVLNEFMFALERRLVEEAGFNDRLFRENDFKKYVAEQISENYRLRYDCEQFAETIKDKIMDKGLKIIRKGLTSDPQKNAFLEYCHSEDERYFIDSASLFPEEFSNFEILTYRFAVNDMPWKFPEIYDAAKSFFNSLILDLSDAERFILVKSYQDDEDFGTDLLQELMERFGSYMSSSFIDNIRLQDLATTLPFDY